MKWIVCQIGAREHYAIPRALDQKKSLEALVTDFWVEPSSVLAHVPGLRRLKDRHHHDLRRAKILSHHIRMLSFEAKNRRLAGPGWETTIRRNELFQQLTLASLGKQERKIPRGSEVTLFSYSYAAKQLFSFAKERGWRTVLGQIDPGPVEEEIVAAEHERYPDLGSRWQRAPQRYWDEWKIETELADRIIVNSEWSRDCLLEKGVPSSSIDLIPLVYSENSDDALSKSGDEEPPRRSSEIKILFLGQINVRKGIGRLLDAMRLLRDDPVRLILAGPTEVDQTAWADLPKVSWVGSIPRSEVGALYRSADAFILPTLSDGYALTQLEAMARDLPIIASRRCGQVVRHEKNGLLLDSIEPPEIAAAIKKVSKLDLRMSECARTFTMSDLADTLLQI